MKRFVEVLGGVGGTTGSCFDWDDALNGAAPSYETSSDISVVDITGLEDPACGSTWTGGTNFTAPEAPPEPDPVSGEPEFNRQRDEKLADCDYVSDICAELAATGAATSTRNGLDAMITYRNALRDMPADVVGFDYDDVETWTWPTDPREA
jgi:hypothetical protein